MQFIEDFRILIKSRYPFIYISSIEEERVEYTIRKSLNQTPKPTVYTWDFVEGYKYNPNIKGFAAKNPIQALNLIEQLNVSNPTLFILKDFNYFLTDISVKRKLKNLNAIIKNQTKTIIILSNTLELPNDLNTLFTIIEFELPNSTEIKLEIQRLIDKLKYKLKPEFLEQIVRAAQGLPLENIRQIFSKSLVKYKTINQKTIDLLLSEKKQRVRQTQLLEFPFVKNKLQDIGGLENLKGWLKIKQKTFSNKANLYGLPTPKGVLLIGVPGTGKSLTAKAIAGEWQLPLLRLDMGRLFNGIVGESEKNVREMIQIIEALSPCILWIDEMDKAFTDTATQTDSGTTKRVMGTIITWLAEKTSPIFVVATANQLDAIPIEIVRKGRFDEIFFVDLPTKKERHAIFSVFLQKYRPSQKQKFDLETLSNQTNGFSGAEIEQAILDAMTTAFYEKREFNSTDLTQAIKKIIPFSKLNVHSDKDNRTSFKSNYLRLA